MSRTTPLYVIWQFRQVVDYLLSLDHVTFGAALQQSLRKAGCAPNTLHDLAAPEQLIDSLTHRRKRSRTAQISTAGRWIRKYFCCRHKSWTSANISVPRWRSARVCLAAQARI